MIHAEVAFTFTLVKALLNRPAHGRRAIQFSWIDIGRCVAKRILDSAVLIFSNVEPDFIYGAGTGRTSFINLGPYHPQSLDLSINRAPRSFHSQGIVGSSARLETGPGRMDGLWYLPLRPSCFGSIISGHSVKTSWFSRISAK